MYNYYKKAKEKAMFSLAKRKQMSNIRHLMTESKEKANNSIGNTIVSENILSIKKFYNNASHKSRVLSTHSDKKFKQESMKNRTP